MSSSRNNTSSSSSSKQHHHHHSHSHNAASSSPLVNGSSSSSSSKYIMSDQNHSSRHFIEQINTPPPPNDSIMFHRGNSSRIKSSTMSTNSSSSTSSSPSFMISNDGAPPGSHSSRGNLVKQLVDNLYSNSPVPNNVKTSPNHSSTSASSVRSSFRNVNNGGTSSVHHMSPSTQQRSFGLRTQMSEPHNSNQDNHSPKNKNSYNSPSLDRKSITRSSLPVGASNPYFPNRSGSGMSNTSFGSSVLQHYGQINQPSNKNSPKPFLDGEPIDSDGSTFNIAQSIGSTTWIEILEPRSKTKMFANLST